MSKKWIITIVAFVIAGLVVCAGMGALRWGEMIYRQSGGERGWSVGAGIYQMLGWGGEAYEEDFQARWLRDADEDATADCTKVEEVHFGHRLGGLRSRGHFGHRGAPHFLIGFGCLAFLGLLAIPGLVLYRRWRDTRNSAAAAGE